MAKSSREQKIIETLSSCNSFGDPQKFYSELIKLRENFSANLKNVQMIPKRAMKLKLGADFDSGSIQPDAILPTVERVREGMKNA